MCFLPQFAGTNSGANISMQNADSFFPIAFSFQWTPYFLTQMDEDSRLNNVFQHYWHCKLLLTLIYLLMILFLIIFAMIIIVNYINCAIFIWSSILLIGWGHSSQRQKTLVNSVIFFQIEIDYQVSHTICKDHISSGTGWEIFSDLKYKLKPEVVW